MDVSCSTTACPPVCHGSARPSENGVLDAGPSDARAWADPELPGLSTLELRAGLPGGIDLQVAHPLPVLFGVTIVTALALFLATHLELKTGFESLLPESRQSVIELKRVSARTASLSTIFVVLEGADRDGLRRRRGRLGTRALRSRAALVEPGRGRGPSDVVKFLKPRAGLFAKLANLETAAGRRRGSLRACPEVVQRRAASRSTSTTAQTGAAAHRRRFGHGSGWGVNSSDEQRYPDGYYQSQDGRTLVIAIRSGVLGSDFGQAQEALRRVGEVVARVDPKKFDPGAHWGLTGDLAIGLSEYKLISRDLTDIGLLGAALILGVVLLYYLRLRTVLAMALAIGTWPWHDLRPHRAHLRSPEHRHRLLVHDHRRQWDQLLHPLHGALISRNAVMAWRLRGQRW